MRYPRSNTELVGSVCAGARYGVGFSAACIAFIGDHRNRGVKKHVVLSESRCGVSFEDVVMSFALRSACSVELLLLTFMGSLE